MPGGDSEDPFEGLVLTEDFQRSSIDRRRSEGLQLAYLILKFSSLDRNPFEDILKLKNF